MLRAAGRRPRTCALSLRYRSGRCPGPSGLAAAASPDHDEPRRQRHQVHRQGNGSVIIVAGWRRTRRVRLRLAVRDQGIGIPAEAREPHLRPLHPGRRRGDATLRRHRARPRHRQAARRPLWAAMSASRAPWAKAAPSPSRFRSSATWRRQPAQLDLGGRLVLAVTDDAELLDLAAPARARA